ncbi:DMT family transporter [Mycobacterium sp. shizuoka-1]|uniref:DMT family transporter n=1 Tax=Mycobacterium sp. shizuoka-1 TaxID=2039281 RepID=UPI000C065E79|nr:DMT family transporter [Mycobacterium sp. shizuoka-1]GAY18528.1 membrane protein [Mycobacterium sp. shizuoka-1]
MTARGWVLFAAMSVIWGIPYLLIKVAVDEVSVPVLVFTRSAVGAALLLPLALSRQARTLLRRHWKAVAGFAFFEMIAAWLLLSDAERHLTSSLTGLLIAAAPIIAAVLDRLTGGERLGPARMAGLGTGLAGVALLAAPGLAAGGVWPVAEVLLTATCYAIAPLIAARYLADVPGPALTSACLGLAALVYLTPAALTWPRHALTPHAYGAIAALAGICTALAFVVFFALIREVGATRALLFTYVNPAVALVAGVVLLREPLTWFHIAGLVLILAGSVLAGRRSAGSEDVAHQ